jgi:hypothetical protein
MNGQENSVPVSRNESRPPAVAANVGVIFYNPILTPILSAKLRDKLKALHHSRAVVRVLHHGGGRGLDETGLRIARGLGSWQDRAHADDDTAVARASSILIAVGPRPERNAESGEPVHGLLVQAQVLGRLPPGAPGPQPVRPGRRQPLPRAGRAALPRPRRPHRGCP